MTTIAYRDGVLAGDGCVTDDEVTVETNCRKVVRLKDGRLVATAGDAENGRRLVLALDSGSALPILNDCSALIADERGYLLYEGAMLTRVKLPYYAIGSGAAMAFAAMDAGCDAHRAVKIAAARDPHSGGRVTALRMGRTRRPKQRPRRPRRKK